MSINESCQVVDTDVPRLPSRPSLHQATVMAFTASEYWARQNQQRYQTPTHNRLNPVVTDFHPNAYTTTRPDAHPNNQPNGTEVQRWAQVPPTPPSDRHQAPSAELLQMRNYMLQTHLVQTRDVATLERQIRQHDDDIYRMHQVVGQDVRALQAQLTALR